MSIPCRAFPGRWRPGVKTMIRLWSWGLVLVLVKIQMLVLMWHIHVFYLNLMLYDLIWRNFFIFTLIFLKMALTKSSINAMVSFSYFPLLFKMRMMLFDAVDDVKVLVGDVLVGALSLRSSTRTDGKESHGRVIALDVVLQSIFTKSSYVRWHHYYFTYDF